MTRKILPSPRRLLLALQTVVPESSKMTLNNPKTLEVCVITKRFSILYISKGIVSSFLFLPEQILGYSIMLISNDDWTTSSTLNDQCRTEILK